METTEFSQWLRAFMKQLGKDEAGFAELVGLHKKTVYRYLSGRDPKMAHIIKLGLVAYIEERRRRVGLTRRPA